MIDKLMSGSSLELSIKKPQNSEFYDFLVKLNLQHKTLITKAYFRSSS